MASPSLLKTESSSTDALASEDAAAPVKLENPQMVLNELNTALLGLSSPEADWKEVDKCILWLRCLALFDAELLTQQPPQGLFHFLISHANSLRSAVTKGALNTFEEMFTLRPKLVQGLLEKDKEVEVDILKIIGLLTLKSVNEKRFIADGAKKALDALCRMPKAGDLSNTLIVSLLNVARTSKNPKMTSIASSAALLCLESMSADDRREFLTTEDIIVAVAELESGKSTEARPVAQAILRNLSTAQGINRITQALDALSLGDVKQKRIEEIIKSLDGKLEKKNVAKLEKPWLTATRTKKLEEPSLPDATS